MKSILKKLSSVSYPLSPVSSSHLSHVSCQLSAVSCPLSVVSCQLSDVSCPLSPVTCPPRIRSAQQNVGSGRSWRLPDTRWQNKTSLRGSLQAQTLYHATPQIAKSTRSTKLLYILHQLCNFDVLHQDSECLKLVQHSLFYN